MFRSTTASVSSSCLPAWAESSLIRLLMSFSAASSSALAFMFVSDERNVVFGEYIPGERAASAEFARGSHRVLLSFAF